MKTPDFLVVTPRFVDGNFAGYTQVGGSHYFDTDGHVYAFVPIQDYNELRSAFDSLEESCAKWKQEALKRFEDEEQ